MSAYIARRLLQAIPVLMLSSIAVFLLIHLIPGDPAHVLAGPDAYPEQIEAIRRELGLDKPLHVQYAVWVAHIVRGDLGQTIQGFPIAKLLPIKLRATVELALGGLIVGLLLSFPLGILSAVRRGSWIDRLSSYFVALTYALPTFWLGLLLVIVFSLWLNWFPPSGRLEFGEDPLQALRLLVLPSLTVGLYFASILARFLKSSLLEVLSQDYMRTARAKGLTEWAVIYRHALKNALIPVVTVLGLQLGTLLGGAVVAEAIFSWPGLGSTLLHAILIRDYATVQATMLLIVTIFIAINLITDIIYAFLDPRIRYQ